jgi:hypothetical protein
MRGDGGRMRRYAAIITMPSRTRRRVNRLASAGCRIQVTGRGGGQRSGEKGRKRGDEAVCSIRLDPEWLCEDQSSSNVRTSYEARRIGVPRRRS